MIALFLKVNFFFISHVTFSARPSDWLFLIFCFPKKAVFLDLAHSGLRLVDLLFLVDGCKGKSNPQNWMQLCHVKFFFGGQ